MNRLAAMLVLFVLASCSANKPEPPEAASQTRRSTEQGEVVGFVTEAGAHAWRGIPFAASTAGDNRWRAPRPAAHWSGERKALAEAPRCAQLTNEFDADEGLDPGLVVGTEDCLTLDVYAPPDAVQKALPVMVWIHGGGNVWGRSGAYDGSKLAINENVIVVAVQYRVGPLGWFANAAIRDSAQVPEDRAASFAVLDLAASLGWVQSNIAAFGGNPDNVTIFGESAGGHDVVALLASPLAEGLFHRAIVQSGSFDSLSLADAEGNGTARPNTSDRILAKLGVSSAEELRALPLDKFFAVFEDKPGFIDVPRMISDGVALPETPLRDVFTDPQAFRAVPVILGSNRDEMKLFYASDKRLVKYRLGLLPVVRDQEFYDALTGYISRIWRIRAVDEPAAAMAAAGHDDVYSYRFDWDDGGSFLFIDFHSLMGAAHGFEVPFVFDNFHHLGDADFILFEDDTKVDREALGRTMGAYWASFAGNGVPSSNAGPVWPAYGNGTFLRLDTASGGGLEVAKGADSIEALIADLNGDPGLDRAKRCMIVDELPKWLFAEPVEPAIRAAAGC